MARPQTSSIFGNWCLGYFLIFMVLEFTAPVTSKGDGIWFGHPVAFCTLLFFAYRLARKGARPGTCFVFGCGATFLFLLRFFCDKGGTVNFGWWLKHQKVSTLELNVMWVGCALLLGTACARVGRVGFARFNKDSQHETERDGKSDLTNRSMTDSHPIGS